MGMNRRTTEEIAALVASMTIEERASLTAGASLWSTAAVARVGIPEVFVSDGPAGARGPQVPGAGRQVKSLNIPCGSALGATWNPALLEELGDALGDQTRTKGCRILLAPTVNLHRSPLSGRNFEAYSEDPLLTGKLAAALIRGVQRHGVATTVKHLVGNESEFERMTIDSVIDQRALRELYLLPFELAVTEGSSLGIMTSYNRLNGTYNTESREILQAILRDEWGFEGFVVSDWYAAGSTAGAASAGLDLEMPGPARFYGNHLAKAVRDSEIDEALLAAATHRLLTVFDRIGALDDEPQEPMAVDRAEHRALARRAASEAMVLLKNSGVLPLNASSIRTLAVIGPNAENVRIMGGGSAEVEPHYRLSVLDALRDHLGDEIELVHAQGCDIDKTTPIISPSQLDAGNGESGFAIEMYEGIEWQGDVVARSLCGDGRVMVLPGMEPDVPTGPMSFRAQSLFTPQHSGPHVVSMIELGAARLRVDGRLIFDGIAQPTPRGDAYFGIGGEELTATVDLVTGQPVVIEVEYATRSKSWLRGVQLGCKPVPGGDLIDRAVAAAASADAVIVVVGTNNDWETEGHDRDSMDLPGAQAELIERVSAANPNTVIVVNAGAPVTTSWARSAPAVLLSWFGGQEMANALVDVLFGAVDPSGRLATTYPTCIEHTPSYGNFPGEHGQVRYGESVLMGYRWYEARSLPVGFAFGHGLSYSSFEIGAPEIDDVEAPHVVISVSVTNTGTRRAAEVVQCYVGADTPTVVRPRKELKAFEKVWLESDETTQVHLTLDARAFAHWDPGSSYKGTIVPDAAGGWGRTEHQEPGWRIDGGVYRIHIGRASDDIAHVATIRVPSAFFLPSTR